MVDALWVVAGVGCFPRRLCAAGALPGALLGSWHGNFLFLCWGDSSRMEVGQ